MRMKDTTSHMHRTLSWQCLCAYLLLAFVIVIGLYAGVNWQIQSAVTHALHQQLSQPLPQPLEVRVNIWLFAITFLIIFVSTAILHHIFASIALKRLATMRRESSQDMTEQLSSPLSDDTRTVLGEVQEEDMQNGLEQGEALDTASDQNRAKSEMFASLSQEIGTPMNGIIGMTNKLFETSLNHDQQQYMTRLQEATRELTKILDEVLDLSELEAQRFELEEIPFDLCQTLASCLDLLAEQAQAKQLTFYCCVMSEVPKQVRGDAERVGQILYNLLANAVKSTDAGTVAIRVSGRIESDDRVLLNFEIHNTARGAESEAVADGALTYNGDETELGLTISEQLIQLMQGRIDIQSLAGEGTISRFDICLGYVPDPEVAATSLPLRQMSVLYVDSSELNGRLFCEQFASWGMAPAKATDASSAISVLSTTVQQENVLPLVVIRHDPPTLDGYALCHDIRSYEAIAATKILLLTVADNAATPLESDVSPFDSSLTFPIHATVLHDALLQVLSPPVEAVITHEERFPKPAEQDPSNAVLNILLVA